ncbi:MAG: glycosyltransferase [Crocinitomicaceae bacterium]|nr:glycosyltransferase [Crocinitomicaceae bacterium]
MAHTLPKNVIVELRGNISNKEVLEFYQFNHVDLFIHVSLLEGFGFSIIEAFSFGIPAILYPGGAVKELIDERYCIGLSENCDELGLAEAIKIARKI